MQQPGYRARTATTLATVLLTALITLDCAPVRQRAEKLIYTQEPGLPGLPTTDPTATRAYLTSLYFVPTPKVSVVECHNGIMASIRIYPEFRSHHLDYASARTRGRIVARIENAGPGRCDDLSLDVGQTAYWWMGPDRNLPVTTNFYRIPVDDKRPIERLAHTGETKKNDELQSPQVDAWISKKSRHSPGDDDGDLVPAGFTHNITWIACLGGCCESALLVAQ